MYALMSVLCKFHTIYLYASFFVYKLKTTIN